VRPRMFITAFWPSLFAGCLSYFVLSYQIGPCEDADFRLFHSRHPAVLQLVLFGIGFWLVFGSFSIYYLAVLLLYDPGPSRSAASQPLFRQSGDLVFLSDDL
jgi:hypothetical protein